MHSTPRHIDSPTLLRCGLFAMAMGLLMLITGCTSDTPSTAERFNRTAYDYHYRNLDSTLWYARQALEQGDATATDRAEAINHMAFVALARMNYTEARRLLDSVSCITGDHIERLVADVQLMRLCQRCSENKHFYDHRERAEQHLRRIHEESNALSLRQQQRLIYAESEYYIVLSTYYYYMGLQQQSVEALSHMQTLPQLQTDTAQYLAYLYNYGAGGCITEGTAEQIAQQEWQLLTRCYQIATHRNYPYWQANALQAISEHLLSPAMRDTLLNNNRTTLVMFHATDVPDSLLAGQLASNALDFFAGYGDVYQMAGAYRTLARCYQQIGDYQHALTLLHDALDADTLIMQAPDLVASISEQLSIVNAALNDKAESDRYRNMYLDLIGHTQQDKAQESIAEQLANSDRQRTVIIAILGTLLLLSLLAGMLMAYRQRRRNNHETRLRALRQPLEEWTHRLEQQHRTWKEEQQTADELLQSDELVLQAHQTKYMEQRAKLAIVNSITPLIDRILVEYQRGQGSLTIEQRQYIHELTLKIEDYNRSLTQWIQMQQGSLNLHIESFPLQRLLDIVAHNKTSFTQKGITLNIAPTDLWVKGDPTLTLFMINTIADNARRFTPQGGHIDIGTSEGERWVEVSISDSGKGMTAEQCANLFKLHATLNTSTPASAKHHGFGLLNCRGIIEKYRKMSPVFSVCEIGCESSEGQGSRFHFRLPRGIVRRLSIALLMLMPATTQARQHTTHPHTAAQWADSAYFANINAHYEEALRCTQQALSCINKDYRQHLPKGLDTLLTNDALATIPPEVEWLHHNISAPYDIMLDARNEAAVAALALHDWQTYYYNNRVYTSLYKELTADNLLLNNIKELQHNVGKKNSSIIALLAMLVGVLLLAWLRLYRPHRREERQQQLFADLMTCLQSTMSDDEKLRRLQRIDATLLPADMQQWVTDMADALRTDNSLRQQHNDTITLTNDQRRRIDYEKQRLHITNSVLDNTLSTLKHETMYFPSRIRTMLDADNAQDDDAREMTEYYKTLHSMLAAQAQQQTDTTPLPSPRRMVSMLVDTLNSMQQQPTPPQIRQAQMENYSEMAFSVDQHIAGDKPLTQLFNFDEDNNQPLLLCRQIVRDIGESTNHRACGIRALPHDNKTITIVVTLPTKIIQRQLQHNYTQP